MSNNNLPEGKIMEKSIPVNGAKKKKPSRPRYPNIQQKRFHTKTSHKRQGRKFHIH